MKFLGVPSSGSIAGTTSSHNRAGQYTRNRRMPVQPTGTGRRGAVKAAFGAASSAWSALTGAVQAAWASYAASHPYTDSLGQAITLTGHQMFVAINCNRQNCGLPISGTIPVSTSVFAATLTSLTAVSAGAITLTPGGAGAAGDFLLVALSAPQSSGVSFCRTFWQVTHLAGNAVAATVLTAAYQAQFGVPPVGTRIFYKLTPVNQYGVEGTPNIGYVTVT
jgi:hypothetical protein